MPQAIPWVISLFQGGAFGGGLAVAAAGVAANAALAMAVNAAVTNNTKTKEQGGLIDLTLDSAAPRQLVIGKRMVGGVLVDWYLAGSNNVKLYLPVYLSEGPCGQITRVFAGGRVVWTTPLVHGVRTTIPDFRSGGDRLWVTYYDGRVGQTADSVLVGLGQGWTSNNKMTGCAWVLIECQWDSDNMRSPPSLSFEMEGAKLYDRRLDTTAGGSGSQRIDNPATWTWSDNPAVALDHFMLGRYLGDVRTMGIGLDPDDVPYDRFAAQANVCDEDVDLLAGGNQKRYRANGVISAAEDYASVVTKLCGAMAARPADFGGRFGVIGVESRTPVMTIDDADVIADTQEIYQPKRSWSALVGAVEGRFQDPAQLYQPTDFPRVTDATWETEDGGEPKVLTLDLEFETNVERAQRLALLKARMERRQATLRGTYPLWTVELERGDWFIRTGARWGVDGKTFEVVERIIDPATYTVTIVAQEVDAADSAWDETTAQDGPPAPIASTDTLSDVEVPAIVVTAVSLAGTASSIPALKVAWTAPTDPRVRFIYIECENTDGTTPKTSKTVAIPSDVSQLVFQDGIVDGDEYAVSAKFLTDTIQSEWCVAELEYSSGTYAVGTAASVAWSGVTGSGKPENNADVTLTHTASAITGQGWGATADENTIRANQAFGLAKNALFQKPFTSPGVPTDWSAWGTNNATFITRAIGPGKCMELAGGAGTNDGFVQDILAYPGKYLLTAEVRRSGGTFVGAGAYVAFYNGATYLDQALLPFATTPNTAGVTSSTPDGAVRFEKIVTAPAGTTHALLYAMTHWTGHGSTASANQVEWYECDLKAASLVSQLGADVTLTNTSAGITGQGDLATANRASLPFGVNGVVNSEFNRGLLGFQAGWPGDHGLSFGSYGVDVFGAASRKYLGGQLSGTPTAGTVMDAGAIDGNYLLAPPQLARMKKFALPVIDGDLVYCSAKFNASGVSSAYSYIMWVDAAGNDISTIALGGLAPGTGSYSQLNNYIRNGGFAVAPTNARWAFAYWRGLCSGTANPYLIITEPMLCRVPAGQTAVPVYSAGRDDPSADETGTNTAAAITGQGTQATANAQRGTSYSGTPVEGSWWSDTSVTGQTSLKFYTSGAWQVVAKFVDAPSLTCSFSPSSVSHSRYNSSYSISQAITATAGGGSGSYSYSWFIRSLQDGDLPYLTGIDSATATLSSSLAVGEGLELRLSCTVTDTTTGATKTFSWTGQWIDTV